MTAVAPLPTRSDASLQACAPVLSEWPVHVDLATVDLDLKDRARLSAFSWRGQFSPETVDRLLRALCPADARVLDPFVGSGTTLIEAARQGRGSIGLDINPAAVALARAATWSALTRAERRARLAGLRSAGSAGRRVGDQDMVTDFHTVALLAGSATDLAPGLARLEEFVVALPPRSVRCEAFVGDARATGLEDDSVDFVLTSPPYINVVNYHQHGRPLTDGFGWPVLNAARREIGSNRQNRSNRFRTVVQYAIDMTLALVELARVVARHGTLTFVVGRESRVRGVPFCNSDLLARLVERIPSLAPVGRGERQFLNRYGTTIYEDVLVVRCTEHVVQLTGAEARKVGGDVGSDLLAAARCQDLLVTREIRAALECADTICPSGMAS